jgi:uncharacterized protein
MADVVIIYHQVKPGVDCPDGIAAAWVADRYYRQQGLATQLRGCTYDENLEVYKDSGIFKSQNSEDPIDPRIICVVDFSFPAEILEWWILDGFRIVLLDHHKTALAELSEYHKFDAITGDMQTQVCSGPKFEYKFNLQESGATLALKHFFPNDPMPEFLRYVRDRDLWEHKLPQTKEIHEAMSWHGRSFSKFDEWAAMTPDEFIEHLGFIGERLMIRKREAIAKVAERQERLEVAGYLDIPTVRLAPSEDRLTSDICEALYQQHPEALFVCCINSNGAFSLRSNKDGNNTDVGAIAKAHGGGGHHNAAGFSILSEKN